MSAESIEVTVAHVDHTTEGMVWLVWESEYPDEGAVLVSSTRPTEAEIRNVHPDYVPRYIEGTTWCGCAAHDAGEKASG